MRMDYHDIELEIRGSWDQLTATNYPEDLLGEWADSAVPVYNNDIIADWTEMPSSYNDEWMQFGMPSDPNIIQLMTLDLSVYYRDQYFEIYNSILEEKEEEEG